MKLHKPDGRSKVEKKIDNVLEQQLDEVEDLEDVSKILSLMEKRKNLGKSRISPDTMAVVVGNLLGIVLVMSYERNAVIVSKAFGMILRGRV